MYSTEEQNDDLLSSVNWPLEKIIQYGFCLLLYEKSNGFSNDVKSKHVTAEVGDFPMMKCEKKFGKTDAP